MNKLNSKIYYAVAGTAAALLSLTFLYTMLHIRSTGAFDIALFDPYKLILALPFLDWYVLLSEILPQMWTLLNTASEFYADLVSEFLPATYAVLLFSSAGFLLVLFGIFSGPSRNCKGPEENPREYIFTSRRRWLAKSLAMPWNSYAAMFRAKYVPVIIPIFFTPFIIPFALAADIIILVAVLIAKGIMSVKIKSAAMDDRDVYDSKVGYAVCPKCKRTFRQPKIRCKCGSVFEYPVPGVHGLTEHVCNKGHSIPCTNENGVRGRLPCICPFCNEDIPLHEAKPIVFSMIGAAGSGKTAMMVSAAESIGSMAKSKGMITEFATHGISKDLHAIKDVLPPTVSGESDSECMFMWSRDVDARELIFNDISGTEFEPNDDRLIFQDYYKYTDGYVFAVDPMAVMAFHKSDSPIKSNKTTVSGTLESFYNVYAMVNGTGPSVKSEVPMAIVITKMDNPRVSAAMREAKSPEEFFRKHGESDFVRNLSIMFSDVKYFTTSSLGGNANPADPFLWIMEKKDKEFVSKLR